MAIIKDIQGREILDSRGNPTVEVEVFLEIRGFGAKIAQHAQFLFRHRMHAGRQQAPEFEFVALGIGKSGAFVADRIVEDFHSAAKLHRLLILCRFLFDFGDSHDDLRQVFLGWEITPIAHNSYKDLTHLKRLGRSAYRPGKPAALASVTGRQGAQK